MGVNQDSRPAAVRRGPLWTGIALGLLAIPLVWPLSSGALAISFAGGVLAAYGLWAGGLPYTGLTLAWLLTLAPSVIFAWLMET